MIKTPVPLFLLIIVYILTSCSPVTEKDLIRGTITDSLKRTLLIDGQRMAVSEDGSFNFNRKIKSPVFLDISYANFEWSVFLQPESHLDIQISGRSPNHIAYRGDLVPSNTYLLSTMGITEDIEACFNETWVQMHQLDQEAYLSRIDSLKGVYLDHLSADPERYHSFSGTFLKAWKTEINFALDKFILYYPRNHLSYTGEEVELSAASISHINHPEIDMLDCFDLPSYKAFTEDWIDYLANRLAKKEPFVKHYNLMKMDAVSRLISDIFTNQYLKDYWYAEYLKAHIENNGLPNSQPYINHFEASCKTELLRKEIRQYIASVNEQRDDHEISIYKSEKGFHLEAHIFKPGDIQAREKRPAIVLFHGGGWNGGNPSWAFEKARHFKELGMIAIAAQYRLCNVQDITATEAMSDTRDLIIWMRQHSDSLQVDSHKIAAYGWSAGAHLVSSAAIFSEDVPGEDINSIPDALVLISPAVSLPKGRGWEAWKYNVFGATTTVSSANPVEHVREGLPPCIILQGRDDTVTPLEGVQAFHDKMVAHGNHCELFIYDGVGHLFTPNTMPDYREPHPDKEVQKKAYDQADKFLKKFGFIKKQFDSIEAGKNCKIERK
jgi:acetyl esterase/lipase